MNIRFLFIAAAAIGSASILATSSVQAQNNTCPEVVKLEADVAALFKEYGTLDNRQGQARKPIVKQQIVEAQAKLDAAKKTCAESPCGQVPKLEADVAALFKEYGTLDNRQGQARKPIVKQQIVEAQAKLDGAKKSCAAAPAGKPPAPVTVTAASTCKVISGEQCYWMESNAPNCWVKSPMPAPDAAACLKLDSCSPGGGKASGGGCYKWSKSSDAPAITAPTPGDRCSPAIGGNSAAAGVCGPVCDKQGLSFAGNWSCDGNHPPVKACSSKGEGICVCGCGPKK